MSVKKQIADWYRGRPVENNQQIVFLKSYRQHWTARAAHHVVGFGQRYWVGAVFIALAAVRVAAVVLAALRPIGCDDRRCAGTSANPVRL
jgi:hypothetical protein